ncbi:MAG: hypothetical protein GY929_18205 [Actinomycetia bacterium]|nr:hypothetical protein [Actinomycetes bacterium]
MAALLAVAAMVTFSPGSPARAGPSGPVISLLAVACPDASSVPANPVMQPGVDDTGGVYLNWGPAGAGTVSGTETKGCGPRSGVTFRLSSIERGAALSTNSGSRVSVGLEDGETTTIVGTTGGAGVVNLSVASLTSSQLRILERGDSLWVSGGAPAGFLGLRCHTDQVNSDDLEYLRVTPFEIPSQLTCVHYSQGAPPAPTTTLPIVPVTQPPPPPAPTTPTTLAPPTSAPTPTTAAPAVTQLPAPQPSTTSAPASSSTTRPTSTTTATGAVAPSTSTAAPSTTAATSTPTTEGDDGDLETALPAAPGRILVSVAAPGSGPLSGDLTTVWTQDLLLSLACGDDELEIRIASGGDSIESSIDVPPHLVNSRCDLTLLADGIDRATHDAGVAQITVDGTRLAPGETVAVELDASGPAIDAVYAAVGDESVLPALVDPTSSEGGDRLPLVPVGLGLLGAALAGGLLIGRTGNRR